ncbi:MAG: hypothetical protein R6U51_10125 [Anaerolineales bacterium]
MELRKLRKDQKEEGFTVAGGLIEVQLDIITLLAEAPENVEEIDVKRAKRAREESKKTLEKGFHMKRTHI